MQVAVAQFGLARTHRDRAAVHPHLLGEIGDIERIAKTKYELIDALPQTDSHSYFYNDGSYCLQMYQKTEKPKTLCGPDESADDMPYITRRTARRDPTT